jgi:hypothetical protein
VISQMPSGGFAAMVRVAEVRDVCQLTPTKEHLRCQPIEARR